MVSRLHYQFLLENNSSGRFKSIKPKEKLLLVFPIIPTIENYEMVNEQFCGLLREKYGQIGNDLGIEIKTLFITEGTTITQQAARKDWNVINKISSTIGIKMAYAPDHIFNFYRDLKIQEDPLDLLRFLPKKRIDSNILLLKSAKMSMEKENIKLLMDSIKSSGVVCVRNCGRPEALGLDPLSLEKLRAKLPVVKPQFQPSETRYLLKEFLTAAKKFLTRSHKIIPLSSAVTVIANERAQFGSYYKHEMPEYIQASNLTYWMISDELAPQYKKNVPKKENIGFLFLPENISKTKCNEAESEFVYLIKTGLDI
ncbi:Oidioi.mRNA.OKI2018_I69.chr2.g4971.t1.cds [Oikopleura dioica]|uniref:Oidioi.mRNA.OKI2018_I69.chr2.g4971.t1.cds n=1 Tax=Oikopleura dioica TaxID=34765 RepID=A0ABN7T3A6_OIKDI|nr:Oidioi.mRNA.OKI2018_I69.chr2.g4971.t1.cds [Oikopleura dioica]